MAIDDLPRELICEIFCLLDHSSLSKVAQTSRKWNELASDRYVWRSLHLQTFSPARTPLFESHADDFARRIRSLREFIVRGTNDYEAKLVLRVFSEICPKNGLLLANMIEASDIPLHDILFQCQGYALSSRKRISPRFASKSTINSILDHHRDRLQDDPRSQVFLMRMLLARHTGFRASSQNPELFLMSAHLVVYDSTVHPLFHFPPRLPGENTSAQRYNLRSAASDDLQSPVNGQASARSESESRIDVVPTGPVINWGVVETIHSLVKLYRDRMGEAIPNFIPSRDDYEIEVPMQKCMFDADLSGNWRGLYGYLDFRELEVLDESRAFTPDYFDGIQNLKINEEMPYDTADVFDNAFHEYEHHHHRTYRHHPDPDRNIGTDAASEASSSSFASGFMAQPSGSVDHQRQEKQRFTADGHSMHGNFHIHGSTHPIPGMEPGFKIVQFDEMYNSEGRMPWIMSGIYVPSIGIIGRWRDRTEPQGEGVEGPYVLWRDRVRDLQDQEAALAEQKRRRQAMEDFESIMELPIYILKRQSIDLNYIVVEERAA